MKYLSLVTALVLFLGTARAEPFEITEKGIRELQAAMAERKLTSEQLVIDSLKRIAAYDISGPKLKAVIPSFNPVALIAEARQLDRERVRTGARGPLHGIPVLLKDTIDAVGFPTSGGTTALSGAHPTRDAFLVARLRKAGAIILGKTNLDELQMGGSGLSTRGGQTRNPYSSAIPGGSSAGAGAGIAAGFAVVSIGADTNGSIRLPASLNNLCGLRPTMGLVSRTGSQPGTDHMDVLGPMARSMTDLALTLDVLAGADAEDAVTARAAGQLPNRSYSAFLDKNGLKGRRLGYISHFLTLDEKKLNEAQLESLNDARRVLRELSAAGAVLVPMELYPAEQNKKDEPISGPILSRIWDIYAAPGTGKAKKIWDRMLPAYRGAQFASFSDFLGRSFKTLLAVQPAVQRLSSQSGLVVKALESYDPAKEAALHQKQIDLQKYVAEEMDRMAIDAIVIPPFGGMVPTLSPAGLVFSNNSTVLTFAEDVSVGLSSTSGLPSLVVPAGFRKNSTPVGLQFVGRAFSEPDLMRIGYAYEQATHYRRLPASVPALPRD